MKLHGRITVFGEYLVKNKYSYSLCLKSHNYLSNDINESKYIHKDYCISKDLSLNELNKLGYAVDKTKNTIYGNLPLGYGLSSSTVLTILHLNSIFKKGLIQKIDKVICGFSPSNLDYTSIIKQETGVMSPKGWISFNKLRICYSLILVPKEKLYSLKNIFPKLQEKLNLQISLTTNIFQYLIDNTKINYEMLYDYCKVLNSCNIYSKNSKYIVEDLLFAGVCAKCVGGLYDKALLVIYEQETDKIKYEGYLNDKYDYIRIIE